MPRHMEILGTGNEKNRVYIAVLTLALLGLALVFSTWQTVRRQKQANLEHLELTSMAVLQAVESSLRRNPGSGMNMAAPGTREFFRDLENNGDILFVGILDEKGARILSDGENTPPTLHLPSAALAALQRKERWQGETDYGGKQIYVAFRPFASSNMRHHGMRGRWSDSFQQPEASTRFLMVGVDMDKHLAVFREFKRTAIFQAAYILAAAIFLLVLAVRFISRRELAGKASYLERFQARLIDSLPDSLLLADAASGVIQAANPAAQTIFAGYGSLMGKTLAQLGLPDTSVPPEELATPNSPGNTSSTAAMASVWRQVTLGGMHLEMRALPFQGEEGTAALMVIVRDRTDIHTLEKSLAEAEKLAAIGSLAAGVAHEIRNPLAALRGFAQYFAKKLAGKNPEEEYANTMVREADRLNRVITDLLYLAKPRHLAAAPVDLQAVCADTVSLLQFEMRDHNIDFAEHYETPTVTADPDGLKQVLLNLFLNAMEAMRDGPGTLTVSSAPGSQEGKIGVVVTVADTGPGMPEEIKDRAFEPFHTSKEQGTGLGLALVRAIMRSHGGEAAIAELATGTPGSSGCVITLFFPDDMENEL